jgi:uncharacterized membrane protein YgaE (UPF0421/DUF939 family)
MGRQEPPPKRQRGRELATVLFAFTLAAVIGKSILSLFGSPPFVVGLLIFIAMYVAAYFVLWRLTAYVWG